MFIKVVEKKFIFVKDFLVFRNVFLLKILLYIIFGSYNGIKYIENVLVESKVFYLGYSKIFFFILLCVEFCVFEFIY